VNRKLVRKNSCFLGFFKNLKNLKSLILDLNFFLFVVKFITIYYILIYTLTVFFSYDVNFAQPATNALVARVLYWYSPTDRYTDRYRVSVGWLQT